MIRMFFVLMSLTVLTASPLWAADQPEGIALVQTQLTTEDFADTMAEADLQTLEGLRKENFDFNAKDTLGNTPLYYLMVKNQDPELVRRIISYGADVNTAVGNGMIPLNVTTSKANELQLQIMMMQTMGLDVSSPEVQETLKERLFKEMNRMIRLAQILIENGADVNKESVLGSPLTNAVTNVWNRDIVELLLKAGANPNWQDKEGRTALFYAAASGNDDIVTLLLKAGADPNIQDKAGKVYLDVEKMSVAPAL